MYPVASKTPTSSPNRKRKKTPSPESSASRKNIIISPQGIISDRSSIQIGRSPIFAHSNRLFPTREAAICESYKAPEPLPQLTDIFHLDEKSSLELTHAHPDSPETSESYTISVCYSSFQSSTKPRGVSQRCQWQTFRSSRTLKLYHSMATFSFSALKTFHQNHCH